MDLSVLASAARWVWSLLTWHLLQWYLGPAEPLAISAGPDSEPVLETIDLKNILGEQVPVEVDHLCGYWYEKYSMVCFQVNLTLILFCSVGLNLS